MYMQHCELQAASRQASTADRLSCFSLLLLLLSACWLTLLALHCFICVVAWPTVGWLVGWLLVASFVGGFFAVILVASSWVGAVRCAAACSLKRQTSKKSVNWVERTFALLLYNEAQRTKRCDATRRDYCQLPAKQPATSGSKAIAAVNNFN